jgi:hypothetical protein
MFATLEEKLVLIGIAALACVAAIGWTEHLGYARCEKQGAAVVQKQAVMNAATAARQTEITHEEASSYAASVAAPVLNPVHLDIGLCDAPGRSAVPASAPSRPLPDGETSLRGPDHGSALRGAADEGTDLGPGLQAVGQDADARVLQLQDYITRVCLAR